MRPDRLAGWCSVSSRDASDCGMRSALQRNRSVGMIEKNLPEI